MTIRFDGKVAIVTGSGQGLGRAYALALAARGAKVVVNDLGGSLDGSVGSAIAADAVVAEIAAAGGEATSNAADVTDAEQVEVMVQAAVDRWGRVDILVNNAGILRDRSFSKMEMADFRKVVEVHLFGAVNCIKAVWERMREQNYGRIVVTTSSAGLYGNFGQTAYAAAKLGLVGLMKTLSKEGAKSGIRVNAISPAAATRMTEAVLTPEQLKMMTPESVAAGLCYLVSEAAPSRVVLTAGAGAFAVARIVETAGCWLPPQELDPDGVSTQWSQIADPEGQAELVNVEDQSGNFLKLAAAGLSGKS